MEATTVERRYLRYREAEQYTGYHRVTLWRAVREGRLKASGGYGRAIRFDVKDLDAFMTARNQKQISRRGIGGDSDQEDKLL